MVTLRNAETEAGLQADSSLFLTNRRLVPRMYHASPQGRWILALGGVECQGLGVRAPGGRRCLTGGAARTVVCATRSTSWRFQTTFRDCTSVLTGEDDLLDVAAILDPHALDQVPWAHVNDDRGVGRIGQHGLPVRGQDRVGACAWGKGIPSR